MKKSSVLRPVSLLLLLLCAVSCGAPPNDPPTTAETTAGAETNVPLTESPLAVTVKNEEGTIMTETLTSGEGLTRFTGSTLPRDFVLSATVRFDGSGEAGILFRAADFENGYLVTLNTYTQTVKLALYRDNKRTELSSRSVKLDFGCEIPVEIRSRGDVVAICVNENPLDTAPYPKVELALTDYAEGDFGFTLRGDVRISEVKATENTAVFEGKTYTNPVTEGADPDVQCFNGKYYMYNRISDGNNVIQVSVSQDMVLWRRSRVVFVHEASLESHQYMSPNVFYYDGLYYLITAARNKNNEYRLYYATATKPDGDFKQNAAHPCIHDDVQEIGGHPFIDEDGRLYMTYVRFGGGNHIWIEELTAKDGVITPVPGTLTKLLSPREPYEIDEHGNIVEGGVLKKHNGYYYMIYASGHYLGHYGESYAVSENVLGPYTRYENNEILTYNAAIDGVGDAVFVDAPNGELLLVYHCHNRVGLVEPRETCIDRVKFVPNPAGGPDILTVYGPTTTPQPAFPKNKAE